MNATTTSAETARCLDCRRPIRSADSFATGRGAGCRAKIRRAAKQADLSAWTPQQVEDARQAIEDGAVVPSTRPDVFHVVSIDGTEVHRVHRGGCNCANGLKNSQPRACWHRCAVAIVLGVPAHAVPARAPLSLPAAPVPATQDVWAALEAVGALDPVPAF